MTRDADAHCVDPNPLRSPRGLRAFRRALLDWFDRGRRSFPWRDEPSEYRTVVSEFMLQQTRATTVLRHFDAFVARFPSFEALGRATDEEAMAAWSGLGYYRRARTLRAACETIAREHGGRLPRDPAALLALPGFGEYTAAAAGSIALGLPLAAFDGNVRRVVSRLFASDSGDRELKALSVELLDPARPGDWNQSVMELGATVCIPRAPRCDACPVRRWCAAAADGRPESYPPAKLRPAIVEVRETAVAVVREGKVLLVRRPEGGAFAGMWELPRADSRDRDDDALAPRRVLIDRTGLRGEGFREIGGTRAAFTHHRIRTTLHLCAPARGERPPEEGGGASRWFAIGELPGLAAGKAQKRLFEAIARALDEKKKSRSGG